VNFKRLRCRKKIDGAMSASCGVCRSFGPEKGTEKSSWYAGKLLPEAGGEQNV
jgi:hypothetical protein